MITIRPFRAPDAASMSDIYRRSVTELGPRAYGPQQVAVWASLKPSPERLVEVMNDGRHCLVAVNNQDQVMAFGDIECDGHIEYLYASPDIAGTGVVAQLYDALENAAKAKNIAKLYSEASELAKSFLLKRGFSVVERRDFEVNGVPIHNFAVEKRLRKAS
ncbi:GNAT family N-acetyltransferase [Thalassospira australica]|uniref:GNAT family N-acetyltransferase n=1 Tax=Thalassospira australica TaxID=1528106 RepID=UPI0009DCA5E5|nr:GNAT family N-acetyltransferase [Thalassospira australica]